MMNEILLILIITSLSCSIIGIFLMLRNLSMVSDAISHAVLLGIVIVYSITKDLSSPLLIFGAGIFGVFTIFCIDILLKIMNIKGDAAIGIIFSLFFAIAVILISKYARNTHIDIDTVFMGEIIYAPLNTINIFGYDISKSLVYMSIILIINLSFTLIFYKELKVGTFDKNYAMLSGFSLGILHYVLMMLSSVTAVTAFDAVGAILVISFLIVPASTAYLLCEKLKNMIILTVLISIFNSILGFLVAIILNVNISGTCATLSGITFFITLLLNKNGILFKIISRIRQRKMVEINLLLFHLSNHNNDPVENGFSTIYNHIDWSERKLDRCIERLLNKKYIYRDEEKRIYIVTEAGINYNKNYINNL